ncbi:hypothetical protein GBAR_LOCUS5944, partial [Geodia barretti]
SFTTQSHYILLSLSLQGLLSALVPTYLPPYLSPLGKSISQRTIVAECKAKREN